MFDLQTVKQTLGHNALIGSIDTVPKGHIRIETGFLYPDGASIDVFLENSNDQLPLHKPKLTDFGNTWSWLQNLEMRPNKSPTQKQHFGRIMELYNCTLEGAAIEHEIEDISNLPTGIIQIGQACLRTADLVYAKRFRLQNSFSQDVDEVIAEIASEYESNVEVPLNTGKVVKLDFKVHGQKHDSAVLTLASGNAQSARTQANEMNARWDDLLDLTDWTSTGNQCVTIYDDRYDVYDTKDLDRLARKSILLPFSDTDTFGQVLRAA